MAYRKIIHIDMDAFFAAVEQRDHPELRGKPIAVGFDGPRGVVATASYEARRYGIHSAMSIVRAKYLCPELTIVFPDHTHYKEVSMEVQEIFREYTDVIEPLSIDEAFLDVTENKKGMEMAVDIAREIRERIRQQLHLTASAGISYNKFLAKIASDMRKPDGMCVVHPDRADEFIAQLKIEKFWGVGPKTAMRFHRMGVFNGADLRKLTMEQLSFVFGKVGRIYYNFARGIDDRPVVTSRVRKSVGCEQTFLEDINTRVAVLVELYRIVLELIQRIRKSHFEGYTLTLKVKYEDFTQLTRSVTKPHPLQTKEQILPLAKELMKQVDYEKRAIRLIGVSVSNPHLSDTHSVWVEGELDFSA
ncbi:MAG: DNA polymerase IV [Prevotella sp.]|nr:DNA polymerase IV [Prevotella sp.]